MPFNQYSCILIGVVSFAFISSAISAPIRPNDDPTDLVGELKVRSIFEMDSRGLKKASLSHAPWAGDYWPHIHGGIARRYADENYSRLPDWRSKVNYILNVDLPMLSSEKLSPRLSPAEKYDYLVGDSRKTLTRSVLQGVMNYSSEYGLESWVGICDGWSVASIREGRPKHSIIVRAADNQTDIKFFPADIKALASLMWKKALPRQKIIGGVCKEINPATDRNGRVLNPDCFDTNPGTWHLAAVNQLGVKKKSFIFDSAPGHEIWNQPLFSYEYNYFNPQMGLAAVKKLEDAVIPLSEYSNDKFRSYRTDRDVHFVVGVHMKIVYIKEPPVSLPIDKDIKEKKDKYEAEYYYDLELDEYGKILGGEWHSKLHPDFLWLPGEEVEPDSMGDKLLTMNHDTAQWSCVRNNPIPASWQAVIPESSSRGQPLKRIVRQLIRESRSLSLFDSCSTSFYDPDLYMKK